MQIDTMKISTGRFQYTAIDDCTRLRVLGLYSRRTTSNAVHFLEQCMIEEFPFPIQRVQTDRGGEFSGWGFKRPYNGTALSSGLTVPELLISTAKSSVLNKPIGWSFTPQ